MDIFTRPVSGISDPVYTTPNSPSLPPSSSSPSSALRSSRSPQASPATPKSVSFSTPSTQLVTSPPPSTLKLGDLDWANIVAVAQTIAPSNFNVPSNPVDISKRLTELHKKEEEIAARKKNLEAELAEIRSEENDIFTHRSQLIQQLEKLLSPQSSFPLNALTAPPPTTVPTVRPRETTIIEELDPEPVQPRSSEANGSTPITKKRPGPASKTILSGLKVINPGSLPPLGPISGSAKKSPKDGNDSSKRAVTTGVKQSRPQPMRARKRNKPEESGSSTVPQSQANSEIDQAYRESLPKSPAPAPAPSNPHAQPQAAQPQSKPSTTLKTQVPIVKNPVIKDQIKIKIEPKSDEKSRNPSQTGLKKNDLPKPSPFKERVESNTESEPLKRKIKQEPVTKPKKMDVNTTITRDEDADHTRSNPVQGGDMNDDDNDDDTHSDSEIFNALLDVQASPPSNGNTPKIAAKKVKKEPEQSSNLVTPKVEPQEATRREPNIKQEK